MFEIRKATKTGCNLGYRLHEFVRNPDTNCTTQPLPFAKLEHYIYREINSLCIKESRLEENQDFGLPVFSQLGHKNLGPDESGFRRSTVFYCFTLFRLIQRLKNNYK